MNFNAGFSAPIWSNQYHPFSSKCTCEDVAEFVGFVPVAAEEVGQAHHHESQDGDQDAQPLADH